MILVPPNIQSQLGDAVGIIADSDFWERWDTLVDVSKLGDFPISPMLKSSTGPSVASYSGQSYR